MRLLSMLLLTAGFLLSACQAEQQQAEEALMVVESPVVDVKPEGLEVIKQPVQQQDQLAVVSEEMTSSHEVDADKDAVVESAVAEVVSSKDEVTEQVAETASQLAAEVKEVVPAAAISTAEKKPSVPAIAEEAATISTPVSPVSAEVAVPAVAMGDAVAGAAKARKCKACHSFGHGEKHKVGPNLFAIYGSAAGKATGFRYGNDLKAATFTWDDAALMSWLCNSKTAMKSLTGNASAKTKMSKQNVCGDDAENVVAFLKTLK